VSPKEVFFFDFDLNFCCDALKLFLGAMLLLNTEKLRSLTLRDLFYLFGLHVVSCNLTQLAVSDFCHITLL